MTIQEKLQQLSEDDLREQVVIPLMWALGCATVRCEQGASEFGKDVVYSRQNIYDHPYHGAIVLKAGRIHQGDVVGIVQRQVQEAWTVEYPSLPDLSAKVRMTEVTVMTSFDITPNARITLGAAVPKYMPHAIFVDGTDLERMICEVVKKAKRYDLAHPDYEFDASNFHELCGRVKQSSGSSGKPETPAISATSSGQTEIV